jgi:hypothetical protein
VAALCGTSTHQMFACHVASAYNVMVLSQNVLAPTAPACTDAYVASRFLHAADTAVIFRVCYVCVTPLKKCLAPRVPACCDVVICLYVESERFVQACQQLERFQLRG